MVDFLWHLRGTVALDGPAATEAVLDRVEELLERQRKPVTGRGADFVTFNAPLWSDLLVDRT